MLLFTSRTGMLVDTVVQKQQMFQFVARYLFKGQLSKVDEHTTQ